jgi:uncharacterized membrane protein
LQLQFLNHNDLQASTMYIALKILHVLAVVIFLGNLITGVLWKVHADQTKDPAIIRHTVAGLIRADRWFTIPGVALILIGGFGAALVGGLPLIRTRWILAGIVLVAISGLAYMARVVPLQRQMLEVARAGVDSGSLDFQRYAALTRSWNVWGTIALVAPLLALIAMIAKP